MAGRNTTPGQSVSDKLLSVLGCFDPAHRVLTLTEIARRSGLPLSSTRRFVITLTGWGGLERTTEGGYQIGVRLWRIGALAPRHRDLRTAALPFMHDLYAACRENVHLAILDGQEALVLERISNSESVPIASGLAVRLPLHCTGVGKVLLAYAPPELLVSCATAGLERVTRYSIVEPGRLGRELATIRRDGIGYSRQEMGLGTLSVAAPVMNENGGVVAALGVVVHWTTRTDRLELAVRTAAAGIARAVSSSSDPDDQSPWPRP